MVVVLRMRTLTLVVWWSLIWGCSLVGMGDRELAQVGAVFEALSIYEQQDQDVIMAQAHNPNLLSYLLSLSLDSHVEQVINRLEAYAISFVQRDDCQEVFASLPENIFKVMVRLHFYERYQQQIDSVKICEFYDQLYKAQSNNNGEFDFSEIGLTTLDGFIDLLVLSNELHPVKDLVLWENQLTVLSQSLKLLPELKSLDVMKNKIRRLPEWIGELKSLERLNLAGNQLSVLPDSIGDLENLKGLYLSFNWITQLPESFGRLRNLRGLYMKKSSINQFPCSFCHLTKLEILVCDKGIKNLLPYTIRQQLKRAYEALVGEVEQSGRTITQQQPQECVWVQLDLGPAYSEYL
jgi:Leucine-rich repeat (LRR) protein